MADYNIYLRTVGGDSGEYNPVKPFQTGGGDGGDGAAFASKAISQVGAVAQNPDSAFGAVTSAGVGAISKAVPWVGVAILAATILARTADNIYTKYESFASSSSGDYSKLIKYNNFKRGIYIAFHPFSATYERWKAELEITKTNVKNEQERLLTGGTILNAEYGRYL